MKKAILLSMLGLLCIFMNEVKASSQLYGAYDNDLWVINCSDPDGQAGSVLISGELGQATEIQGLAYNSSDGFLYGGSENSLWRINPVDGAAIQITSSGDFRIDGLAFNPSDGLLYAGSRHVTTLWTIDPSNGSSNIVADIGILTMGLAYNSDDGCLYSTRLNDFWRIDPTDWAVTTITETLGGIDDIVTGLAYNPIDNYFYGGNNNNLRKFKTNGEFTVLGTAGDNRYAGLAFVPEPATLTLIASSGLAFCMRRKGK